jgi:hypothetical protein
MHERGIRTENIIGVMVRVTDEDARRLQTHEVRRQARSTWQSARQSDYISRATIRITNAEERRDFAMSFSAETKFPEAAFSWVISDPI